jgi:hypothetical protein
MSAPAHPAAAPGTANSHLASPDLHPSFMRGLFLGEIREELVFPFPELSAEEAEAALAVGAVRRAAGPSLPAGVAAPVVRAPGPLARTSA